jgi:tRNA(Ile)-lysidine synthase
MFAPFDGARRMALAVSGGSDSTALMRLAALWRAGRPGPEITVLTVDHGLRPAAKHEAGQVAQWAGAVGLEHVTLEWTGERPKRAIQAKARDIRYRLMLDWCGGHDVRHLALGHTLDDQAETLLMRLARGSGVDGLAAMAPVSTRGGVDLVRPLLGLERAALRRWLETLGQDWLDDPSNLDPAYERIRVRAALKAMASVGLSAAQLARSARRLGRAREALDEAASRAVRDHVRFFDAGCCLISHADLLKLPEEIALRLLSACISAVSGAATAARLSRLEALYQRLRDLGFSAATLSGARLFAARGQLVIVREHGRYGFDDMIVEPGAMAVWDRRFEIAVDSKAPAAITVRPPAAGDWAKVKRQRPELALIPAAIGRGCVAFYRNKHLIAVPHAGFFAQGSDADQLRARFIGADHLNPVPKKPTGLAELNRIFTNSM